ncbi:MAG: plasmid partition protein ParG [Gallionella sp.]
MDLQTLRTKHPKPKLRAKVKAKIKNHRRLHVQLEESMHIRLATKCNQSNRMISDVVRELIQDYLNQ